MPRPEINYLAIDLQSRESKRRLLTEIAPLTGVYSVSIEPRKATRSLLQNAAWHALIVKPFYEFLRAQNYEISSHDVAHLLLKEKLLRVPIVNPETGECIGTVPGSTRKLSTSEFCDLYERAQVWLADEFGIITADPDPAWREHAAERMEATTT